VDERWLDLVFLVVGALIVTGGAWYKYKLNEPPKR
jgi:hypothetical protein